MADKVSDDVHDEFAASRYRLASMEKAGLQDVDRSHVERVVYEASKGSRFFLNEQRKEAELKVKVDRMLKQLEQLKKENLTGVLATTQKFADQLEASRDLSQTWIHVDMDAFYVSVEMRDRPELQGKPCAVGGMSMLSTANYEARKFGVRSAMPGFIAVKLCPELIILPANFSKYRAVSMLAREIFNDYDPEFTMMSLDEAHLNVTAYIAAHPPITGEKVASEIRKRIFEATQLTASAGIACNKLLAKICSDRNKPNGQFFLPSEASAIAQFMHELPIRKLLGVGKVTERLLQILNVTKCPHVYEQRAYLSQLLSPTMFEWLMACSMGIGTSVQESHGPRKSMSTERTFRPIGEPGELFAKCRKLCESLAEDLASEQIQGKTLTMKLKLVDFTLRSRAVSLSRYISSADDLYKHASELLKAELPVRLRLMGVRLSQLRGPGVEPEMESGQRPIDEFWSRTRAEDSTTKPDLMDDDNDNGDDNGDDDGIQVESHNSTNTAAAVEDEKQDRECPVCERKVHATESQMDAHVNNCLESVMSKRMQAVAARSLGLAPVVSAASVVKRSSSSKSNTSEKRAKQTLLAFNPK